MPEFFIIFMEKKTIFKKTFIIFPEKSEQNSPIIAYGSIVNFFFFLIK